MSKNYPRQTVVYTYDQIINELDLPDSAFLTFTYRGLSSTVQDSHLVDELLSDPKWAASRWTYLYETSEWIPIFRFEGTEEEWLELVDVEVEIVPYDTERSLWVTPKGHYREQYYKLAVMAEEGYPRCAVTAHDNVFAYDVHHHPLYSRCFDGMGNVLGKDEILKLLFEQKGE